MKLHLQRFWFEQLGYRLYIKSGIAVSRAHNPKCQECFIDISVIFRDDARTGIQRVVRSIYSIIIEYRFEYSVKINLLYFDRGKYRLLDVSQDGSLVATCAEPKFKPGDLFLGLDFSLDSIWQSRDCLAALKRQGVRFWFLIHDTLPLTHPYWFARAMVRRFHNWMAVIGTLAEGFFCVSAQAEADLRSVLVGRYDINRSFETHVIPMGWDVSSSRPSQGLPPAFDNLASQLSRDPVILMVGTIEPRKGHIDVLSAMEALWNKGFSANLVIVGSPGWHTEKLQKIIRRHRYNGTKLFWLQGISDEALSQLYTICTGVIMASYAEGFGLPLAEAIGYGKPVLARDIEVFRTHADKGVTYFDRRASAQSLASAIARWLEKRANGCENYASKLPTWHSSAAHIGSILLSPKMPAIRAIDTIGYETGEGQREKAN